RPLRETPLVAAPPTPRRAPQYASLPARLLLRRHADHSGKLPSSPLHPHPVALLSTLPSPPGCSSVATPTTPGNSPRRRSTHTPSRSSVRFPPRPAAPPSPRRPLRETPLVAAPPTPRRAPQYASLPARLLLRRHADHSGKLPSSPLRNAPV